LPLPAGTVIDMTSATATGAQGSSAPLVGLTAATRERAWPPTVVKLPPT
jgi:hypothetical protein